LPWVYLAQYVPLTGFLNLLADYSSNRPEALFHAPSTCGIHPPECSPWEQHRPLVEVGSLVIFYRSPIHHLVASHWNQNETARCSYSDEQCDPADRLSKGVNPLPSPFTSCASVTHCRRPILSWVLVPSRGIDQVIPTRRLSSHVLEMLCKQNISVLQSLENHPARTSPEGLVHPL
jgi:hypothetical protein